MLLEGVPERVAMPRGRQPWIVSPWCWIVVQSSSMTMSNKNVQSQKPRDAKFICGTFGVSAFSSSPKLRFIPASPCGTSDRGEPSNASQRRRCFVQVKHLVGLEARTLYQAPGEGVRRPGSETCDVLKRVVAARTDRHIDE